MLPDANLWLALAFEGHFHHVAAKSWLDSLPNENTCHFCRLTQQAFLRLSTNSRILQDEAVPLNRAWELYDTMLEDHRIVFAHEPPNLEAYWRGYTQGRAFSPKVWNDAYLAGFARAASLTLVTFDQGFREYANLSPTLLA